jgi:biopolymer transport protein ExbD
MSSAPGGHDEVKCEPDLTPLLDMVLQLVMFFMLCANFIMEQTNESVKLPIAVSAKAINKSQDRMVFVNLTFPEKPGDKSVLDYSAGTTRIIMKSVTNLKDELERRYKQDEKLMAAKKKEAEWTAGKGRSLIIVRADNRLEFKVVAEVMAAIRAAGYSDVQLRALRP